MIGNAALGNNKMKKLNEIEAKYLRAEKKCLQSSQSLISENDWKEIRLQVINFEIFKTLLEFDLDSEISEEFQRNCDYILFNQDITWLICLVNDLFSAKKDIESEEYKYNIIHIRMLNNKSDFDSCIKILIFEIKALHSELKTRCEKLKLKYPLYERFFDEMLYMVKGYINWSLKCQRFNH